MVGAKEAIDGLMKQLTQDVASQEVSDFSENHLANHLKVMFPNILQTLGYAK